MCWNRAAGNRPPREISGVSPLRMSVCQQPPTNQATIIAFVRAMGEIIGSMPVYPGIFLDYLAPIVRNAPYVVRKLFTTHWGMPSLWMEPDSGTHEYP